jgi:uncharacterized membrane-anchored protein
MNPWIYLFLFLFSVIVFIASNEIAINFKTDKDQYGIVNIILSYLVYGSLALALFSLMYMVREAERACDVGFK